MVIVESGLVKKRPYRGNRRYNIDKTDHACGKDAHLTGERKIEPFVRIQIASPSAITPKEIRLSRLQFELILFLIPVILLWGLASTAILVKTLYIDRPQTNSRLVQSRVRSTGVFDGDSQNQNIAATNVPTRIDAEISNSGTLDQSNSNSHSKSEPVTEMPSEKQNVTPALAVQRAEKSFEVEHVFGVDVSVERQLSEPGVSITVAMTNLTKHLESGRYWLALMAVTKKGQKIWLTPMPEVNITNDGEAQNPELGHVYSFRSHRKKKLSVTSRQMDIARFETLVIGFLRTGKSPAMVKTQLIPR